MDEGVDVSEGDNYDMGRWMREGRRGMMGKDSSYSRGRKVSDGLARQAWRHHNTQLRERD